jgi:hypothetical protein
MIDRYLGPGAGQVPDGGTTVILLRAALGALGYGAALRNELTSRAFHLAKKLGSRKWRFVERPLLGCTSDARAVSDQKQGGKQRQ